MFVLRGAMVDMVISTQGKAHLR